jgi:hypothetical protein
MTTMTVQLRSIPGTQAVAADMRDPSLDHLIGGGQKRFRDGEAEGVCGLEIDQQLELCRLLYRQIGRLGPLQNLRDIIETCLMYGAHSSVTHQAAFADVLALRIYRRNLVALHQRQVERR